MFEENENIFPSKPELAAARPRSTRSRFFFTLLLALFVIINFFSESYVLLLELLLVLIIHELGHYLMMRIYHSRSQGLFVTSLLGGIVKQLPQTVSQRQQVFTNLMGPLPGIIIGTVLLLFMANSSPDLQLIQLAFLLIGINVLNLLPLDPFDGGRIIESIFFNQSDQSRMVFTLVSSLFIIGAGVYLNFIPLMIFGLLMGFKVRGYQKSKSLHDRLKEDNVDYKKEYSELTNREYWKIRNTFLKNNPRLREMIPSGYTLWENENLLMEQVKQLLRVNVRTDLSVFSRTVIILFVIILIVCPLWLVFSNYELVEWYIENAGF